MLTNDIMTSQETDCTIPMTESKGKLGKV